MGVNLPCVSQTTVKRVFWHSNDLRRIYRAPLGVFAHPVGYSVKLSFARMILSDVLHCTVPPLRVQLSLLKHPILQTIKTP